jgi:iron complex outermembrane receptor protein
MKISIRSAALASAAALSFQSFPALAGEVSPQTDTGPEQVVITSSPFAQNPIDTAASVSQVSRSQILTAPGTSLGDLLRDLPGVASTGFTTGASRPVIRGFNSTRVRVTENGIGSADASDISDDHAVAIDPLAASRIEVLRGAATLRYGSQAIGGVVNSINNRIPINVMPGVGAEGFAGVNSNGIERLAGGVADYRTGNWAFHADGSIRGVDDYSTPLGKQVNSFAFGRGFALGGAYIGTDGAAGLGFNQFISRYGIPTPPEQEDQEHEEHEEEEEHEGEDDHDDHHGKVHVEMDKKSYRGEGRLEEPLPFLSRVTASGGWTDYEHKEISNGEILSAIFRNKEWENRVEALHKGFGIISQGAVGVQYNTRDFSSIGHDADYLHPTRTRSVAVYVFEQADLTERFSIQGSLRTEWTGISGDTDALGYFNRTFQPFSAALGGVFKLREDLSLFANLSSTERAPNPVELFAQGPHNASRTYEFGDPTFKKERAKSIEGGIRLAHPDGDRASFTMFHTNYDNFINGFLTGNSYHADGDFEPDLSAEFRELVFRQQKATFWGLEGDFHWHILDWGTGRLGVEAQTDYVRATLDAGGNVPRITPFRYGGGLFYESTTMELRFNTMRIDRQNALAAFETPTPGYWMVNAFATFHVYSGPSGDIDVSLSGTNLTDEVARNAISFTKDYLVLPGRTFRLMLHILR